MTTANVNNIHTKQTQLMEGYKELKKYLDHGDLKEIAHETLQSYSLVSKVFAGTRKNSEVEMAILAKVETRKQEKANRELRKKELAQ